MAPASQRAPSPAARSPGARLRRLFGSAKGAILTAGALAGAVAAVLALVPHHRARHPDVGWKTLQLAAYDQTLQEFATRVQRRSNLIGSTRRAGVRLAATGAGTTYWLPASHTYTTPSPSPHRARHALRRLRPVPGPYARQVVAAVDRQFPTSGACTAHPNSIPCGLRSLLPAAAHDEAGNLVSSIEAAQRLVTFLQTVRTHPSARQAPLGVYLSLDLRLHDLAGQRVLATFTVLRTDGSIDLPGRWARDFVAFDLAPKTNDQHESTVLWVPEPSRRAHYLVELTVLKATGQLSSQNSSVFR